MCGLLQTELYRSKSSLVIKGEVVTHQLDCAAAPSAARALTRPAVVAAVRASCGPCALLPSVSQITMYLVKVTPGGPVRGCGVTRRKRCAAIQPGNASTSPTCPESAASNSASPIPGAGS